MLMKINKSSKPDIPSEDSRTAEPTGRIGSMVGYPLVLACDEGYAMPLATTLRSVCESNEANWPLQVHVLTDGFSAEMRSRVETSLPSGAANIHWIQVDLEDFQEYRLLSHVSAMTFARLDIPALFDGKTERVLYLDADILVLGDLAQLWRADLRGAPIGAVTDLFVNTNLKSGLSEQIVGIPRVANYFNAGILLFDIRKCIASGVTQRALEYLRENPNSPYADQDALNVACDGIWTALDPRWNFQGHDGCRIDRLAGSERPSIVHFITNRKPWKPSSTSYNARLYDQFRSRTLFRRSPKERVADAVATLWHRACSWVAKVTTARTR